MSGSNNDNIFDGFLDSTENTQDNNNDNDNSNISKNKKTVLDSSSDDDEVGNFTNHQPECPSEYSDDSDIDNNDDGSDKHTFLTDSDASSDNDGDGDDETEQLIENSNSFVLNLENSDDDDDEYSDDDGYEEYKKKKKKGILSLSDLNPNHEYKCACCGLISSSWVVLACEYCEKTVFCAKCFRTYDRSMKSNPDNCIIKMKCEHCKKDNLKPKEIQYAKSVQDKFAESTTIQCPMCTQEVALLSINQHVENTCSSKYPNKRMKLQSMLDAYNRNKEFFRKRLSKKNLGKLLILGELASKSNFLPDQEKLNAEQFLESNNEPEIRLSDDHAEQKMFEVLLKCKEALPKTLSIDLSSSSSSSSSSLISNNNSGKRKLSYSLDDGKVKRKKQKQKQKRKLTASVITMLNFYK